MADIDSIVKGAAIPSTTPQNVKSTIGPGPIPAATPGKPTDPTNNAPNSPSMIYLNLLILEASLRAQFLELRARRRHHTFFFALLTAWVAYFGYQLFLRPREDGVGVGGSIYWAVEGAQKVCFMGGIITAILVWAVGIWDRGIRWPRRWFAISNRGLRPFNCKLVIIRRPWWAELLSSMGFFLTNGLFSHTASSSYRYVEPSLLRQVEKELQISNDTHPTLILPHDTDDRPIHEEDLAPGGDYVKLLLLAKPFSATFRENWELYRSEYWERENERRALLRKKVRDHDRRTARQKSPWFYWLPWRRHHRDNTNDASQPTTTAAAATAAKLAQRHHLMVDKERKRRSSSVRRGSVSSSSRAGTPTIGIEQLDDGSGGGQILPRRLSNASSEKRRKKNVSVSARPKRPSSDSRSVTPEFTSPLARESSVVSDEGGGGAESGRVLRSAASRRSMSPVEN